ncbi:MAG: hypothetical protein HC849_00140 [Oscillatoriales cyanobacterium RU_3_3]|nr:hypothetical protein [Microcoleus sp. SU_5_3]NJL65671.1 hypothetical protein [Microcoleus sp. SM1_3_4]NJM58955.1 hypothetical protein [Oscillatoriales cyanobacterium RU_3_3]
MSKSIPSEPQSTINDTTHHQRLMELVEAEDAANGEVGCGRNLGDRPSVYLKTCGINISDEKLRNLLREYLGHKLMEVDFDSIVTQVSYFIESLVVQESTRWSNYQLELTPKESVAEYIPTPELKQCIESELGEFCSSSAIEQIVLYARQVIHNSVLQPRHKWPQPIWVLNSMEKVYIAQASTLDAAIARVKAQYPHETGELQVIKVGGLLAPDRVISLDLNDDFR